MKRISSFIFVFFGLTLTMAQSAARINYNNVHAQPWQNGYNILWVDTANNNYIMVANYDSVKKDMRSGLLQSETDPVYSTNGQRQSDTNSTDATRHWVNTRGYLTSAPVTSVNGQTGAVVLSIPSTTGLQPYSDTSNWDATRYWVGQQAYATITQLNTKFNTPSGTTSQYLRGDGSLATFPTIPTQYTDAQARTAISLTTTGSGAATYNNSTGVLNVPTPSIVAPTYNNAPARTLNSSYQISTTKNTRVSYTVSIVTALSLLNLNSSGIAYLEISANNSTWITVNSAGITRAISVAISLGLNETAQYNLQCEVPAGYWARIRTVTSGGATVSFTSGQETQY